MADTKVKAPTQKELYERIKVGMANDTEIVEFCDKKIEQLARKTSSGSAKKTDEQNTLIDLIVDVMSEAGKALKCGEIYKDERISGFVWSDDKETSPQRVNAMLKKMVERGDVVRTTEKKETFFSLA